jgi:CheY-like chemotaxis protein
MGTPGGLNVLLVEDHPDTAAMLKLYLERQGHEVATAGTHNTTSMTIEVKFCCSPRVLRQLYTSSAV